MTARALHTYRSERRNAARAAGTLQDWRKTPYRVWVRKPVEITIRSPVPPFEPKKITVEHVTAVRPMPQMRAV